MKKHTANQANRDRRRAAAGGCTRREFLRVAAQATVAFGFLGFPNVVRAAAPRAGRKVIVLAIDGMDPGLLKSYVGRGLMPHCRGLMERGGFLPLGTSCPPQSPVAWSNFISGGNPGLHGIFDFIARDPATRLPYLATARTLPARHSLHLGQVSLPLTGAKVELLRRGPTLWKLLDDHGIDATVIRAPVNFPPTPCGARTIAGLTTPDIHGSYGIFSLYSEDPARMPGDPPGGHIERIAVVDGSAHAVLRGPANSLRTDQASADVPFSVELDHDRSLARVRIQESQLLLREGEWSDWVELDFPLAAPLATVAGICRFYLKKTKPHLELYVSPVNLHPARPAMPVATPPAFGRDLVRDLGLFYTQGMPENTSALTAGVFDDDEYRRHATDLLAEQVRLAEYGLDHFHDGFLYVYFSTLDLNSHMFWRCIDPQHPAYTAELARRHGDFLPWLYGEVDKVVGRALRQVDDETLLFVISDHGFTSFRRQFNLNSWLMDNGYASPVDRFSRDQAGYFANTDWTRTRAYGLGINSLYLNVADREGGGIVRPGDDARRLAAELAAKLGEVRDPQTGEKVFANVYRAADIYSGPCAAAAPDLILGYNQHYRASWDTILGKYPREVFLENNLAWSGDHCMDPGFLPGVFLCNRPVQASAPALHDLAPTILALFGAPAPTEMSGRPMAVG